MPDGAAFSLWKKSVFIKHAVNSLSLSPLGHSDSFASCKAWCVLISASLPKTPFPRKGAILLGLPPQVQARMLAVSHTKPLHDAVVQMADDLYGGYAPQPHFLITKKFFYRLLIYVFYRNIIYQCGGMELLLLRSGILFLAVLFCQCVKQILYIFAYLTICIKISAVCKLQAARIHRFIAYKNHTS